MAQPNPSFSVGELFTSDAANKFPRGLVADTGGTAGTAFVANTPLTVLSVSATIIAGRNYQICGKMAVQYTTSTTVGAAMYVTANSIDRTLYYQTAAVAAFFNIGISGFTTYTAAELGVTSGSASRTFDLKFKSGADGGLNVNPDGYVAAGSFSQQILILDMGLV